jgi:lipoprotein-releasing system permease protein
MVEYFIAKRYIRTKHKLNFISILSIVSIIGIMIGVAALVIVLSVFNGFGSTVTKILVSFDPHLKIVFQNNPSLNEITGMEQYLESSNEIDTFYPFAEGKALFINKKTYEVVNLKGIQINKVNGDWGVSSKIISGKFNLDERNIILGLTLALKLGTRVGDSISVTSAYNIEKTITSLSIPQTRTFIVSGLFESNNKDYDSFYAFSSLKSSQQLFGIGKRFSGFELRLNDFRNAESMKTELDKEFNHDKVSIETWYDLHKQLYNVMMIERWVAYIILCLIIAVATFNIFASLTMTILEKKKDIGILRSLGVNQVSIKKIFMTNGLLIGITGTLIGLVLGLLVCYLQINYKFYALDPMKYIIDALPIEIRLTDILAISAMAILLSYLAAYYPAKRAAHTIIIESIKYE